MLIFLVTVFSTFCGSLARAEQREVCYGRDFDIPFGTMPGFSRGDLYFYPTGGSGRKTLMENGKVKEPRLKVTPFSARLLDITKKDAGTYTFPHVDQFSKRVQLNVTECAEKFTKKYMDNLQRAISKQAEYLEYTPFNNEDVTLILWNRTDPSKNDEKRGNIKDDVWKILGVVQTDSGFYNFRRRDGSLDSRINLTVNEYTYNFSRNLNEQLFIDYPLTGGPWTVTFKSKIEDETVTLMTDGKLVFDNEIFPWRIADRNDGIDIGPLELKDSGTFEFRDPQGNLALSVGLDVSVEPIGGLALIICIVVVLLLGICCCYCCCKKKCCKKDKPAVVLTQGPVAYHDNSASAGPAPFMSYLGTNQPTGPSYSNTSCSSVYPPHPVNPPAYASPAAMSMGPSLSEPNTTVYPPQPTILSPPQPEHASQVGPLTYQESEAAPTFSLEVSDDQPRFQIKGLAFPSAPPLTADAPSTDVYISDKLNFL